MHFETISFVFSLTFVTWLSMCAPAFSENVTNTSVENHLESFNEDELRHLLLLLDEPASKEFPNIDTLPILDLGDLLLSDDDHSNASLTTDSTPTQIGGTTGTPSTTTGSTSTTTPTPEISRRSDTNPNPTNEQLVDQLALLNSLLSTLTKENETASTTASPNSSPPTTPEHASVQQQLAILHAIFGNFTPLQNIKAEDQSVAQSVVSPTILQPAAPTISTAEVSALTQLLTQLSKLPTDSSGSIGLQGIQNDRQHLTNFNPSQVNLDASASNQLSTLMGLLGTLGSLTQNRQQQPNLFGLGGASSQAATTNLFPNLQSLGQSSQQTPNIFGNLFAPQDNSNAQPQPALPSLGVGSMLSGLLKMFTGKSDNGGPSAVRGKGVDTRVGVGYRLGDMADAQIMWDVGPQLFTDPINNEFRHPMNNQKRQDSLTQRDIQLHAQKEKEAQQIAAARRFMSMPSSVGPLRRNFVVPPSTPTRNQAKVNPHEQEAMLKELWELIQLEDMLERKMNNRRPLSGGMPSRNMVSRINPAELFQMQRNKNLFKRASTPDTNKENSQMLPNKPDEQVGAESFLNFRKVRPRPMHFHGDKFLQHSMFSKKHSGANRAPPSTPKPSSLPGLHLLDIFGFFRGSSDKPEPDRTRPSLSHNLHKIKPGPPSQNGRWDLENHRFDNFKDAKSDLLMTDSVKNDRFHVRNNAQLQGRRYGIIADGAK